MADGILDRELPSVSTAFSPSTPEELTRKYADWIERFGKIAKQAGLKPQ